MATGALKVKIVLSHNMDELLAICEDIDLLAHLVPDSKRDEANCVRNRIAASIRPMLHVDREEVPMVEPVDRTSTTCIEDSIARAVAEGNSCTSCRHYKMCVVVAKLGRALEDLARIQTASGVAWRDDSEGIAPIKIVEEAVCRTVACHCPFYRSQDEHPDREVK